MWHWALVPTLLDPADKESRRVSAQQAEACVTSKFCHSILRTS